MEDILYFSGFLATSLMVISPLVQLKATFTRKTVQGLSLAMLVCLVIGCFIMGLRIFLTTKDLPLLLSYGFNTLFVSINIFLYFKYKNN